MMITQASEATVYVLLSFSHLVISWASDDDDDVKMMTMMMSTSTWMLSSTPCRAAFGRLSRYKWLRLYLNAYKFELSIVQQRFEPSIVEINGQIRCSAPLPSTSLSTLCVNGKSLRHVSTLIPPLTLVQSPRASNA